ncbi:hypothetical protein [Komagataeibacter xylinus]|nr:hypothetical protein [Komagataeibacter xylinus]
MTQHINLVAVDGGRRRFLGRALMSAAAIAAATALPACTVTKNGDITTLTLNVAAIKD